MNESQNTKKSSGGCIDTFIVIALVVGVIIYIISLVSGSDSASSNTTNNNFINNIFNNTTNVTLNVDLDVHPYVVYKNEGNCQKLVKDVALTAIYVYEYETDWADHKISENLENVKKMASHIEDEARDYGAKLNIQTKSFATYIGGKIGEKDNWLDIALSNARLPCSSGMNGYLESLYGVDEAPVLFFVDRPGTSYYVCTDSSDGFEYAVIFNDDSDFRPQLYGMYGAREYSSDKNAKECATKYFSDSVMLNAGLYYTTDPLTAYVIGWTDELNEDAVCFLNETDTNGNVSADSSSISGKNSSIVLSDVEPIGIIQSVPTKRNGNYTGYQTVHYDNCVYLGHFVDGYKSGTGSVKFDNGDEFVGNWNNNSINGFGSYYFANGDIYTGNWTNNMINGNGKYTWYNGDEYDGGWENGKRDGFGLMRYSNNTSVSGIFENDVFLYASDE